MVFMSPAPSQVRFASHINKLTESVVCLVGSLLQKLSLSRAAELSVRTARLPVDEYMVKKNNAKNFHSKILAVNQGKPQRPSVTDLFILHFPSITPLFILNIVPFVHSVRHLVNVLGDRQLDTGAADVVSCRKGLRHLTGKLNMFSC